MIGGSFNYVGRWASLLWCNLRDEDTRAILEQLEAAGPVAQPAIDATRRFRELAAELADLGSALGEGPWHAVERWVSGDLGEDRLRDVLELWRSQECRAPSAFVSCSDGVSP